MAKKISKNARQDRSEKEMMSRWGGKITVRSVMQNGRVRHFAQCDKSGNQARSPKDLM